MGAGGEEGIDHAVGAGLVHRAVVAEGRRRDDEDAGCALVQHDQAAVSDMPKGGCTSGDSTGA